MAIKAYIGAMGHGKTYEVVSVVILNALRNGRRVVSNIAGLNYEAFVALLAEEGTPRDQIGELVCISHEKPLEPNFWRTDNDEKLGIDAFIQPGDLLALDEVWRFWEGFSTKDMPPRVKNFFRMHRQFVDPKTGLTCEIAFICQDIMDLARGVRSVVEETYAMEKLVAVGLNNRYRVDVFRKTFVRRKPLRQIQRAYEAKYFPLYKSHSQAKEDGAGPREQNIDTRGNILSGAMFRTVGALAVLVILGGSWYMYRFFHPEPPTPPAPSAATTSRTAGKDAAPARPDKPPAPDISDQWRLVGWLERGSSPVVVLSNAAGRLRYLHNPPALKLTGSQVAVVLPEGGFATSYGGPAPARVPGEVKP